MLANTLKQEDYRAICEFLEQQAGIRLGDGKEYLVVSRLGRLLSTFDLPGFGELTRQLRGIGGSRLQAAVIDAMTTNETFWFRDLNHFRILTDGGPGRCRNGGRWHPHLVGRVLDRPGGLHHRDQPAGRDADRAHQSQPALRDSRYRHLADGGQRGQGARYCGVAAARGLSDDQRRRYFREHDNCIEVLPQYRAGISFRTFNLLKPFDGLGRFDIVFCRNVLIYFSQERKRDIITRIARSLKPGGHLFLGSTESLSGSEDLFEMRHLCGGLVYRVRG
jgi:chemotaxis protein methyltransferase CheR